MICGLASHLEMGRSAASFKKADVMRLIEAARAAGLKVTGVEVTSDGTLRAVETVAVRGQSNDFDRWEKDL